VAGKATVSKLLHLFSVAENNGSKHELKPATADGENGGNNYRV